MNKLQKSEIERLQGLLPITDPTTPSYSYLMQNLEIVANTSLFEDIDNAVGTDSISAPKVVDFHFAKAEEPEKCEAEAPAEPTAETAEFPAEVETPFPTAVEAEAPAQAVTYTGAEVRSALVKARQKGVNITEILHEFGVENFPAFPENRYAELMAKLEVSNG